MSHDAAAVRSVIRDAIRDYTGRGPLLMTDARLTETADRIMGILADGGADVLVVEAAAAYIKARDAGADAMTRLHLGDQIRDALKRMKREAPTGQAGVAGEISEDAYWAGMATRVEAAAREIAADALKERDHWKHLACDPQTRGNVNARMFVTIGNLEALLRRSLTFAEAWEDSGADRDGEARKFLADARAALGPADKSQEHG